MKNLTRNLALLLALAVAGMAQTGAIEGKVIGPDGNPVGKDAALIKITRTDIKGNYKVKTNKKGEYFHAGLPMGKYDVECEMNGQVVDTVKGVQVRLGDPIPVNFDLAKLAKQQEAMQQAAQTGQVTEEMARDMTPEQKAAFEKRAKEQAEMLKKNKELNDAFNAGMEAMKGGNWDAAVESLEKAKTLDATQHVIFGQLAEAYAGQEKAKQGEDRKAANAKTIENFEKAIELKPDDAAYYNNYGLALARGNMFDKAQEALDKAAKLDPPGAGKYYYNLGALLVNSGKSDPAAEAFKKAIEADPNYADAHYQYGIYLTGKATVDSQTGEMKFPPETETHFAKYLELRPDGPNAESARGMLETMGSKVETRYTNPDAKKGAPAKGATKKKN
jgi:tetratricopeptide (TPR) repeat protein